MLSKLQNIFDNILNFMSITNNIVQFSAFFIAILTLVLIFSVKYIKPIKFLLSPLGIKTKYIIKALVICRKMPRKYIRIFCEYFIIRTQGLHQNSRWWKEAFYDFSAFFKDTNSDKFVYEIDNCTYLLEEEISELINKYFKYFGDIRIRNKFDLNKEQPVAFCMEIRIDQGYLSPNILLSGLLERYKNNWKYLVKRYVSSSSAEINIDNEYSSEVYYTFAWLLWGPSYQIKNQEGHYKICQYAFGDESNSVNIILNNDDSTKLLWKEMNYQKNGVLCSLGCKLYNAKSYIEYNRDNFSPVNTYFINKISDESTGLLLEPINYDVKQNYKAQNYYSTAYVWIMFESIIREDDSFQPQRSITFFEHANMANEINYSECINSLISKSFLHFDRIFSEDKVERKYRYCLSMNKTIEDAFKNAYNKKIDTNDKLASKYKSSFSLKNVYNEISIFSAFDKYFSDMNDEFDFIEVDINDENSIAFLGEYYTSIYIDSFPDINERESLDSIMDYLKQKGNGKYGKNNYHIILALKSGKTVGGIICDYFELSNCGAIEFIAIKKIFQSSGIGTKLYQKALEYMCKDSRKNGHIDLDYIFCEIEKNNDKSTNESNKYLWFWNKMGYKKLQFEYIQPALESGKEGVFTLDLIALPVSTQMKSKEGLYIETLKQFLTDYAKYAMRIETPNECNNIMTMFNNLDNIKTKIVTYSKII